MIICGSTTIKTLTRQQDNKTTRQQDNKTTRQQDNKTDFNLQVKIWQHI
jgi:hypothetical protein